MTLRALFTLGLAAAAVVGAAEWQTPQGRLEVGDHRGKDKLVILVFGDGGTGEGGQYRVGKAMYQVCRERGCDFALMLGDNIYENGISAADLSSAEASLREIRGQFEEKFEGAYGEFEQFGRFDFWAVMGNHDYRRNSAYSQVMYSWHSKLWRMPAYYYEVPELPDWIQVYGLHTDTDVRRDLNGLQVKAARRALCEDRNTDRWKIVFGHQPARNHGHHAGDGNELRFRALIEPVFGACGVDVYLAGHAHHQEHITAAGYEQIIQGAAGKSQGQNGYRPSPEIEQRYFTRDFGFAVLEVTPAALQVDFYSVLNTMETMAPTAPRGEDVRRSHTCTFLKTEIGKPGAGRCGLPEEVTSVR